MTTRIAAVRRLVPAVTLGAGVGLLVAAIIVAVLVIGYGTSNVVDTVSPGTAGRVRFADIALPVNVAVLVLAGIVLALAVVAATSRSLKTSALTVFASVIVVFVLAMVVTFYFAGASSMGGSDIRGSGYPGTIAAVALSICGCFLTSLSLVVIAHSATTIPRRSVVTAAAAIVVTVVSVGALAPSTKSVSEQMISIEIGDRRPTASDYPTRVEPAPRPLADTTAAAYPIGPGFVTVNRDRPADPPRSITMYNGEDRSVRWRLHVPGDPYPELVIRVLPAEEVVMVTALKLPGLRRTIGIDARSGERLWENNDNWNLLTGSDEPVQPAATQGHHLVGTTDRSTAFSLYSPRSGRQSWTYRPDTSCTKVDFADNESTLQLLFQCGSTREVHILDAATGNVLSRTPTAVNKLEDRSDELPDGYRYAFGQRGSGPDAAGPEAVVDAAGRRVVDLTTSDIDCDTSSDECILTRPDGDSIISLSAAHPPVDVGTTRSGGDDGRKRGRALWLRDQVLWPERTAARTDRVVVADRRTGDASIAPGVTGELARYRGGVLVTASSDPDAQSDSAWTLAGSR